MSTTITALFDSRADAELGRQRLLDAGIPADDLRIHDQSATGTASGYSTRQEPGFWASLKNAFLPDEDRHMYEEGVRRGGYLLTADVNDDHVDDAVRLLDEADSVDIDDRASQWRNEGWDYQSARGTAADEERIEVIEEELVVGKREVGRGGVRVRSYVTEVPVHEQVRLRQERVDVERRPVDRNVEVGDAAFRERTIEMTETSEEAVVGKTARVVEEVVIRKTAGERVEEISDTVRRTDVEVEDMARVGVADGTTTAAPYDAGTTGMAGTGSDLGDKAAGLGKEALGNLKQGIGSVTGNESLHRSGVQQEREGERQQGKRPD